MLRPVSASLLILLTASASARDFWVQAGYTGTSDGTSAKPYKHINDIQNLVNSGDVVRVRNGTYSNASIWMKSGVTYKSENVRGAKLVGKSGATTGVFHYYGGDEPSDNGSPSWWSQRAPLSWVTIDGFDISYPANSASECHGVWMQWAHHITIKNNFIHAVPSAGIQTTYSDYITIQDNRVTTCSWYVNPANTDRSYSGITMWKNIPYDTLGTAYPNGFHNYIRRNYLRSNYQQGGSDGNGIIVDTQRYDRGTLVENNVCYSNGGAGIAVEGAFNCTVRFNTLFMNAWAGSSPDILVTKVSWEGGSAWDCDCNNINLYGNLIYARRDRLAIAIHPDTGNVGNGPNLRWHEYWAAPSNVPNLYDFPAGFAENTSPNDVNQDPQFVGAGYDDNANFRLQSYSPARNRLTYGPADGLDIDKFARSSPYDLGAFEYH